MDPAGGARPFRATGSVSGPDDLVDLDRVQRVRRVCTALPEVVEEPAWVGTRWRIRTRTFAHVLPLRRSRPPVYAKASGRIDADLLMFRSVGAELAALRGSGPPFFGPPWRADEVGLVLTDAVDWTEVAELLTESYRAMAPVKLARTVVEPPTTEA